MYSQQYMKFNSVIERLNVQFLNETKNFQKELDLELIEPENFKSGTKFWDKKQFNKNMLIQTFYCKKISL